GTARRPHRAEYVGRLRVHGHVEAHAEEARKFRARPLQVNLDPVPAGVRIARIDQPGAITLQHRQQGVQHIAQHLLEVVRLLDGPVYLIHGLQEPEMRLALLLGALALDCDAREIGNLFDDCLLLWRRTARCTGVEREGAQDPAIRGEYWCRPTRAEPVW